MNQTWTQNFKKAQESLLLHPAPSKAHSSLSQSRSSTSPSHTPSHQFQALHSSVAQGGSRENEMKLPLFSRCEMYCDLCLWAIQRRLCKCGAKRCKSELVIHESSKENESLDTATRTRLLPALRMTSCLFVPLDFLPPFTYFYSFLIHFLLNTFVSIIYLYHSSLWLLLPTLPYPKLPLPSLPYSLFLPSFSITRFSSLFPLFLLFLSFPPLFFPPVSLHIPVFLLFTSSLIII